MRPLASLLLVTLGLASAASYGPAAATVAPPDDPSPIAQLWAKPGAPRDLFYGVGGRRLAPDPAAAYTVIELKRGGFSRGYVVKDAAKREWSVKFPPEAQTEVVASRLLWGIGYHQPPIYYVPSWSAQSASSPNPQLPARFREQKPDLHGLDAGDHWSYTDNPFTGTRQMNGLLVLQVMLGNSDLKPQQNVVYRLSEPFEGARQWYVARDLGQSFGRTGVLDAPRGDAEVFDATPFVKGVVNGAVVFEYRGRHRELFARITPADVRWICEQLQALSDRQWQDAFRAGGYPAPLAQRFIRRMKQKIDEGLALP